MEAPSMQWIAVAAGGAAGAVSRYALATIVYGLLGTHFPWGTMVVNLVGCFGLGVVAAWADAAVAPEWIRTTLAIGFFGAFTTFSTFSLEALRLLEQGEAGRAGTYVLASVVVGIGAVAAGLALGRWGVAQLG
jgi:CrcB protein